MLPQKPQALLWLTENYPPSRGGMAQSCDRIIYGLRDFGIQIHIIHFTNRKEPFKTDTLVNGTYTAIPVTENESHTANLCWNYINRFPYAFGKIVSFGGYMPLITGPVFARWLEVPLITLLRGNDFDASLFNPRRKSLLEDALMASETVGCVTRDQMMKCKKLYPGLNISYTPNGIRTQDWTSYPSEQIFADKWRGDHLDGHLICIGMFGQLKEKKGLEILLDCFRKPVIASSFFLLLAGDYEDSLQETMTNLEISFQLLPFLDRNELIKYYAACDLVVIPSHYEGMPNVLLEAAALGKTVIASEAGGMKDILAGLDENLLFYPGDSHQLESLLLDYLEKLPDQRRVTGEKLKNHIQNNYNSEKELQAFLELLRYEKDHRKSMV